MAMEISEKDYRKVVFDTDNPFVSAKFKLFIESNMLFCKSSSAKGLYTRFTLFLTDEQLDKAEKAYFDMQDECGKYMQALKQKREFLLRYFDEVTLFESRNTCTGGVGIECRMKAWGWEPVHFVVYTDKNCELKWERLLSSIKLEAKTDFYTRLNDICLMDSSVTKSALDDMADSLKNRLAECIEAIEKKITEEEK